jgi:hypothetical protein
VKALRGSELSMETKTLKTLIFRVAAIKRMFQREIADGDVRYVLAAGKTVQEYPDGRSYPLRRVTAAPRSRPIQVVIAEDPRSREVIILTAYPQTKEPL